MFLSKIKSAKKEFAMEMLINEKTSPLFRIMSIFNANISTRRKFNNNICAFNIGNGYILSVAHNLRTEAGIPSSLPQVEFQTFLSSLNTTEQQLLNSSFTLDSENNIHYLSTDNAQTLDQLSQLLTEKSYDSRWITYYGKNICSPYLIIQSKNDKFLGNEELDQKISRDNRFQEQDLFRNTFLLKLEVIKAFYNEDITVYKIVDTDQEIIEKLPFLKIDFGIYKNKHLYCLQSAPNNPLGRLLNDAHIEGQLDQWALFQDKIGGNYLLEGFRYLIRTYFRFGSSGAPYLVYDEKEKIFKVNAIQSEASGIQLQINNSMNGNFQYVNAIATPLSNIKEELIALLK